MILMFTFQGCILVNVFCVVIFYESTIIIIYLARQEIRVITPSTQLVICMMSISKFSALLKGYNPSDKIYCVLITCNAD